MNPCKRMTVSAYALTDDFQILGIARNGNEGECTGEEGNCGCSHAEERLIKSMTERDIQRTEVVLLSHSPCEKCALILYYNLPNLLRVFYKNEYRKTDGLEFLKLKDVDVQQVEWTGTRVKYEEAANESETVI